MLWTSPRVRGYSLNICSRIVFLNETRNLFLQLVTIVHMMALYFMALALLVGPTHHSFQFWEWRIWDGLSVIHVSSYCFRLVFRGVQYYADLLVSSCLLLGFKIPLSHIHCVRWFLWLMKDSILHNFIPSRHWPFSHHCFFLLSHNNMLFSWSLPSNMLIYVQWTHWIIRP